MALMLSARLGFDVTEPKNERRFMLAVVGGKPPWPHVAPGLRGIVEDGPNEFVVVFLWPDEGGLAGARLMRDYVLALPRDRRVVVTNRAKRPDGFRNLFRGFRQERVWVRALKAWRICYVRDAHST